jgi:hypothetical protein
MPFAGSSPGACTGQGCSILNRNSIALFKEIAMEKVRVRLGEEVRVMTRAQAVINANYAAGP